MNIPCKPFPVKVSISELPEERDYLGKRFSFEPKIEFLYSFEIENHITIKIFPSIEFFYSDTKETFGVFKIEQAFVFELQKSTEYNMQFIYELVLSVIKEYNTALPGLNQSITHGVEFPVFSYKSLLPKLTTVFQSGKK